MQLANMSSGVNAVHAQYKPSFLNVAIMNAISRPQVVQPKMMFGQKSSSGGDKKSAATIKVNGKKNICLEKSDLANEKILRNILQNNKVETEKFFDKKKNCGGSGFCGTCVVKVENGMNNLSPLTA